jgi:hypothetical protein
MATICVYEHWRPDTDEPFYVGCGSGRRANQTRHHRTAYHKEVQETLARLGYCVEVRLVRAGLTQEEGWALEVERIAFWRAAGVDLVNQTDGGPGVKGCAPSPETRAKMGASQRTRVRTAEHYAKVSAALTGRKLSAEHAAKSRVASFGRKQSSEEIERRRAANTGRKRSREFCERMRAAWTPERRAAQAERIGARNRARAKVSVEAHG